MRKICLLLTAFIAFLSFNASSQTYHSLSGGAFTQNWTNTGMITTNDIWTGVPSIQGFLGQSLTGSTGTDPQTILLGESPDPLDLDVIANQANPNTLSNGGIAEFEIANPTIAFQGSGTADAPHIILYLNATGVNNVRVQFNLRDIDGSLDNAVQPVALQYRIGTSGNFINLPLGFVADASTGPSLATLVTPIDVTLPAACNNQAQLQVRIITTNAVGNDEWIGIDDINVTSAVAPPSTVSVSAGVNASEPSTSGTFSLTLSSAAPVGGVTVTYTLTGSAILNTDYSDPQLGSVTIPVGSSGGTITLNVLDDLFFEGTETISITLNGATNGYTIGTGLASIDLLDNDVAGGILLSTTYSQNFNSLANTGTGIPWTDNSTIPGWYSTRTTYNAANGSSNAGALYSFGTTATTERALGSVGSGSTGTVFYGARFVNNTGTTISAIKVTYTGEQWRNGGNVSTQTVNFAYQSSASSLTSLTAGTWTNVPNLNFTSPTVGAIAATLDGNAGANSAGIVYTITGLSIPANHEIMIRWEDIDHSGSDHGLGIDNFIIEANPADLNPPVVSAFSPTNGATNIATNLTAAITFDETVQKGTGNITIRRTSDNSIFQTIDVTTPAVTVNTTTVSFNLSGLAVNTGYYIEISAGAFKDLANNNFAGISGNATWAFTTGTLFYTANFNSCNVALSDGFTQYSVTGAIVWACTPFGRDPLAPAGAAPFPSGVQINGFSGGTNVPNVDWLISPSLNLTGTTYPLLSFWSRTAFNGLPLQLKVSTDYIGGNPSTATWTDLNGKFPAQTSNIWTLSSGINLAAFKQANVHFAFVYTSSDDEGARWTIDDVSIDNSPVPPPPSLTVSTTDIQYTYVASGSTADKTFTFIGNDLTADVSLTATGAFTISKDGSAFSSSLLYTVAEANNLTKTVYVRFAPVQNNQNYTGTVTVSTSALNSIVNVKGTSIDPATTLEVVNWNIEWFGSPLQEPTNDNLQEQNVETILQHIGADVYALAEVVSEERLANIVGKMPGYAYVISNYGSHTNTTANPPTALAQAQKLAFVYKTSVLSNISTTALLSQGINSAADLTNPAYNYWASGRFPYMMTADVTLNCVTKNVKFILVHAKANTSPTATSYERRKKGADTLNYTLNNLYPNDNIIILGDFNDDLDQSITAGFITTSWSAFTTDPTYSALTLPLSLAGKKSTVSYNDVIDHVVVSNDMLPYYMNGTANILTDVAGLVSNYGSTTTDHYPVFTRYFIENKTAPVITYCPTTPALCSNTSGSYTIPAITATDDCGSPISYSYEITGATTRSGITNNASGAFAIGTSTITWTVSDESGNSNTCQTIVVVNQSPTVSIPDAYALPTGVLANTVYIGYNPASSITLNSTVSGGTPLYSYSWSNGTLASSTTVSPTTNTVYTLTVTDANNCTAIASKTIQVLDIRAGNKLDKMFICHNSNTIVVDPTSGVAHLAHGDMLGACTPVQSITNKNPANEELNSEKLTVGVMPNPTNSSFTINLASGNSRSISIRVTDMLGRTVEQKDNLQQGQSLRIGTDYKPGIYFIDIRQENERVVMKLVKSE
jgi:hypothetical protein